MKINVDLLEKALTRIIEKLKFENINEIELPHDLYQIIPTDQWQISNNEAKILTGSLVEDLEEVNKLVQNPNSVCTYVDFDRIASILRIISQIQNPPE